VVATIKQLKMNYFQQEEILLSVDKVVVSGKSD
jgi:hypothetical protein